MRKVAVKIFAVECVSEVMRKVAVEILAVGEPQEVTHHDGNKGDSWGKKARSDQTYSFNQVIQPYASTKIPTDKIATIQLQIWCRPRLHAQQREMNPTSKCEPRTTKKYIAKREQLEPR